MWSPAPSCILAPYQSRWHIMNLIFFQKKPRQGANIYRSLKLCFKKNLWLCFGSGVKLSDNFLELGGESLLALRSGSCAKMVTSILPFLSRVIDGKWTWTLVNVEWMLNVGDKDFFPIHESAQGLCILALWTGRQRGTGNHWLFMDPMCGCKVGWVQAPEDEDEAPGDAEVKTWSQLVELPSSKPVCLASQTVTACQHSYLSQHGMLTHDFYYFKMNTDTSICRSCYLSRRKSSCTWKMPKTCFAHHIQAQFGQMSGAFAVSSLLTASVPWQSAALQPCKNHGWGKLVQICPGPIWPSIALFLPATMSLWLHLWLAEHRKDSRKSGHWHGVCVTTPSPISGCSLHVQVW